MTTATTNGAPLLKAEGISKSYGGVHALRDVGISVHPGEAVGIMGDNGAGKSTLIKVLAGAHAPDSGKLWFDGREHLFESPIDARRAGIETVYQDLSLAEDLDVVGNLFLGRELHHLKLPGLRILDRRSMSRRASELLRDIGVRIPSLRARVRDLSGGQRQGVAIARAAGWGSKLIIMDEPTAALGVQETAGVQEIIRGLKASGTATVMVSHSLRQVFELVDTIWVLRRGSMVGRREVSKTTPEEIVAMITGVTSASETDFA
jgi:ABC-type sugar transport system ATPase subunit